MRSSRAAVLCVILSVAGLALCIYLAFLHIALLRGEFLGGAACGATGSIFNCHAVTASPYGTVGGLPLVFWGIIGYFATFTLAVLAWQFPEWASKALSGVLSVSLLSILVDGALLVVMITRIQYLCPLCLATYAINLLLLLAARSGLAQSWRDALLSIPATLGAWLPRTRAAVVTLFWVMMATGAIGTVGVAAAVSYMQQGAPGTLHNQVAQFVQQQRRVTVETVGDPIRGLPDRPVQVVEFSDFLCPSCQRAWKFNPIIFAGHQQEASFIFKHFPLDQACNTTVNRTVHEGACQIAAATECAHEQGKFWAFHDLVFERAPYKPAFLDTDAVQLGLDIAAFRACLQSGRGLEAVKRDVAEGARLGVNSTPTYFVNGIPITGILTPATFEEFLRASRRTGS